MLPLLRQWLAGTLRFEQAEADGILSGKHVAGERHLHGILAVHVATDAIPRRGEKGADVDAPETCNASRGSHCYRVQAMPSFASIFFVPSSQRTGDDHGQPECQKTR